MHSLQFTQQEVDALKKDNAAMKKELTNLKQEMTKRPDIEDKVNKIKDRIDYQEDYSRRNNIHFDCMDEKQNESWEETQETVQRLLRDKLCIGSVQLERAHRVGPRNMNRPRTIVARFHKFEDRQQALRNSSKLKNSRIYINEDLCEASLQLRKAQLPDLKRARADGKIAYFSHTKLIVRDRREDRSDSSETVEQSTLSLGPDDAVVASERQATPLPTPTAG